jgi:hypothetical protein
MTAERQKPVSERDLETLHRMIRRGFTAADFAALATSIRSKTSSRSGRRAGAPKIENNYRQVMLAALFYVRYNYKRCYISQAARDIAKAVDIRSARTIGPTGPRYLDWKPYLDDDGKPDKAHYEDIRSALRKSDVENIATMISALIWWKKKNINANPTWPKWPFNMGGGQPLQHLQVIPKNRSMLFKWIDALEAKLPPN